MPLLLDTRRESEMTGKGCLTTWMLLSLGQEMEKLTFLKVCNKSVKRFNVSFERIVRSQVTSIGDLALTKRPLVTTQRKSTRDFRA